MQLANMFKKGINLGKNTDVTKHKASPEVPEGILKNVIPVNPQFLQRM